MQNKKNPTTTQLAKQPLIIKPDIDTEIRTGSCTITEYKYNIHDIIYQMRLRLTV